MGSLFRAQAAAWMWACVFVVMAAVDGYYGDRDRMLLCGVVALLFAFHAMIAGLARSAYESLEARVTRLEQRSDSDRQT